MPKTLPCNSKEIIIVDPLFDKGVDRKAVYLCDGSKIHWQKTGNVKEFEVVFDTPGPFGGGSTIFGSLPGEQDTTPTYNSSNPPLPLTVYYYTITILDTNGFQHAFDPHIIGGG
jgi:hypothetical protein